MLDDVTGVGAAVVFGVEDVDADAGAVVVAVLGVVGLVSAVDIVAVVVAGVVESTEAY